MGVSLALELPDGGKKTLRCLTLESARNVIVLPTLKLSHGMDQSTIIMLGESSDRVFTYVRVLAHSQWVP